ncbi:MAG: GIY-YIG nuclease family protein [Deltaproteobacteria bacterium]|nr:GIY-YIG nuclease family protein [Deltaproteobacteria bacterium]
MDKQFCVYILASKRNGTLYIGVASQLATRVWQHKSKVVEGFSAKYGVARYPQICRTPAEKPLSA